MPQKQSTIYNLQSAIPLGPAWLGRRRNDDLLDHRLIGTADHKNDRLGDVGGVLQVALVGHRDALLGEAIEEVRAHPTWNDRRDVNIISSPFDAQAAPEADQPPL